MDHPNGSQSEPQTYTRKSGNTNIDGQYYESKLLALVLLRLQNDPRVKSFELGANVPGFGKFDDLVCKVVYRDRVSDPSWWFVQLKHKDNVEKKKITIETLNDKKEDFSWQAYFENYLKLRLELMRRNEKVIFKDDDFESADIKLIYYTTTLAELDVNNTQDVISRNVDTNSFLTTSEVGKEIFMKITSETKQYLVQSIDPKTAKSFDIEKAEELASDFLNKFCIYAGQAKQSEVEEIIRKVGSQKVENCESQYFFEEYHKVVQEYWKVSCSVPVLTENSRLLQEAINNAKFKSLIEVYRHNITLLGIMFREEMFATLDFLEDQTSQFINIYSDAPTITGAKLFEYFMTKKLKTFIFVDSEATCGHFDIFSAFENQSYYRELVIVCNSDCHIKLISSKLRSMDLDDEKVIIVRKEPLITGTNTQNENKSHKVIHYKNDLSELTANCQDYVLSKLVRFQGKSTKLINLVGELDDMNHVPRSKISGELLLSLLKDNEVTIFPEDVTLSSCDKTKYYIDRKFSIFHTINRNILNDSSFCFSDEITDHENREIIVISDSRDRFEQLRHHKNNLNIHWLKEDQGLLVWQESSNGLRNLRPHLDKIEKQFEVKSMNDLKDRVTILAGEPGVGKTTVIMRLVEQTIQNDNAFVIRVEFLDHLKMVGELKKMSMNYEEALKFLAHFSLNNLQNNQTTYFTDFQKSVFERFSKMGKAFLFFDGYEDIPENDKSAVLTLLKICLTRNIGKIWITTRNTGIEADLEEKFSVFSHTLVPFSGVNSLDFIKLYLAKQSDNFVPERLDQFANELLKVFREIIALENENDFLSFPLHCDMVAKCSEVSFQEFSMPGNRELIENVLNSKHLSEFFESIIKLKLLIYLDKKCKINIRNQNIVDRYWVNFTDRYKRISLGVIYEENVFNPEHENHQELIDSLKREGIISNIRSGKPQFVHSAFCHYFAAIPLFEYLAISSCEDFKSILQQDLMKHLIVKNNHHVCSFIQLLAYQLSGNVSYLEEKALLLLEIFQEAKLKNLSVDLLLVIVELWLDSEPDFSKIEKIINDQSNDERLNLLQISSRMGYSCLESVIRTCNTVNNQTIH